ncbi:MAG TPA: hypothetical protein VGA73_07895 [Candidatus Binatia bacterium]
MPVFYSSSAAGESLDNIGRIRQGVVCPWCHRVVEVEDRIADDA